MYPVHTTPSNFYWKPLNTFPFTPRSSEWPLTCRFSLLSHAYHVSRPIYPHGVCHSNYIWEGVQIRKVLIMQSSPVFRSFSALGFNMTMLTLFSTLFWDTFSVSSLAWEEFLTSTQQAKLKFFILFWILNFFRLHAIRYNNLNRVAAVSPRIWSPSGFMGCYSLSMGGACGTYGGQDRCIQGLGGETWGKETTLRT
jgi:hypothetical protein